MGIQSLTPAKLLWHCGKRWKGLNAYSRGAARQIDERRSVQLAVFDSNMPDAAADAISQHAITDVCISFQKGDPASTASLQKGVNAVLRAVALYGKEENTITIKSGNLAIDIQPVTALTEKGEVCETTAVNAVISSLDGTAVNRTGKEAIYFAERILDRLPLKNYLSPNFWRGKLAEIVISNEKLIDHFSNLTNLMLALEAEDFRSDRSKHAVFGAVLERLFPVKDRKTLPFLLRLGLWVSRYSPLIFYFTFKLMVKQAAKLFIGGVDLASSLKEINRLYSRGVRVIIDFVDEEVKTMGEAWANVFKYLGAIDRLPKDRENVISIKLTGIVDNFNEGITNPATREATIEKAIEALNLIVRRAKYAGVKIIIDMERYMVVDATLKIFGATIRRSDYRYADTLGIVNQTYLKRSKEITARLATFARECSNYWQANYSEPIELFIRFVKGAYQHKDKDHVVESHYAADVHFLECLETAYEQFDCIRFAIASHNTATMSEATELAQSKGLDATKLEFEMLKGMPTNPILFALVKLLRKVGLYFPIGTYVKSVGYFLRRMRENASSTSCQKSFREFYTGKISREEYLAKAFAPAEETPGIFIPEKEMIRALADDCATAIQENKNIIQLDQARGWRKAKIEAKIKHLQEAKAIFEKMEREAA